MPKPGDTRAAAAVAAMPSAVYTPFDLKSHPGPLFPLHVGDTWMEPALGARMEDLREADFPGLHRYTDTGGIAPLVDAPLQKPRAKKGPVSERGGVVLATPAPPPPPP